MNTPLPVRIDSPDGVLAIEIRNQHPAVHTHTHTHTQRERERERERGRERDTAHIFALAPWP